MSTTPLARHLIFWSPILVILLLAVAEIIPTLGRVSAPAARSSDAPKLRQIVQSSLIYAQSHRDQLPRATDVWDYARILAEDGDLTEARLWQSEIDPAYSKLKSHSTVLDPGITQPRPLNPAFRAIKPAFAVALGKLSTNMPVTAPIAWTRGLQPDGTWAQHSPYGGDGGYIVFLGGNVAYYKDLKGQNGLGELIHYKTGAPTPNILDALPSGTRIGEYTPTPEEQTVWAAAPRPTPASRCCIRAETIYVPRMIIFLPFVIISIDRHLKKRPGAFTVLLWPVSFIILFLLLVSFA